MSYSVLLVDDNKSFANNFAEHLRFEGLYVDVCYSFHNAKKMLDKNSYDVCIFDILLNDGSGIALSRYVIDNNLQSQIILITASDVVLEDIDEKVRNYIFDFLQKPFELAYAVKRVKNALERSVYLTENFYRLEKLLNEVKLVGKSDAIKSIKKIIKKLSNVSSPVLITGETGTGKELVARLIHLSGVRKQKPFIPVNCSSIPSELFEAEFFGYERGAFTGASNSKKGLFELANDGTLFLDEIGDLNFNFQSKLLRVLETGEYMRIGGTRLLKTNARIIAATNRNLKIEAMQEKFRKDLFFRLSVVHIEIPPLRERREDIPLIAKYLWEKIAYKLKVNYPMPSDEWFDKLAKRDWYGNVRELSNFIEKILILGNVEDVESEKGDSKNIILPESEDDILPLDIFTKNYILRVYQLCGFNKTKTAKKLNISLSTLKRRLKDYGIS